MRASGGGQTVGFWRKASSPGLGIPETSDPGLERPFLAPWKIETGAANMGDFRRIGGSNLTTLLPAEMGRGFFFPESELCAAVAYIRNVRSYG